MSKRLGRIIGCKDKTSSWHLIGFSDGSDIGPSGDEKFNLVSIIIA